MTPLPWFRLYREVIHDRKIAHLARTLNMPSATIIGAWTIMLSLACDSDRNGALVITDGIPITAVDLTELTGLPEPHVSYLLAALSSLHMITVTDGTITITKWAERQYRSDSSTARVRKYRARNVTETLQERHNAVTVTPPEHRDRAESEHSQIQSTADTLAPLAAAAAPSPDSTFAISCLSSLGVNPNNCTAMLAIAQPETIVAWCAYAATQERLTNRAGYVLTNLRAGATPPTSQANGGKKTNTWYTDAEYQEHFLHPEATNA